MTATAQVATEEDLSVLEQLRVAWTAEIDPGADEAAFAGRFSSWMDEERKGRTFWIARDGQLPVGMVNLLVVERMPRPRQPPGRWGYLGNLYVLPDQRRNGVGTLLVDAVLAYSVAHNFERVIVHPNEASLSFWRRSAFGAASELLVCQLS
jgi:GNAT superfamily N-acetyltransferase